MKLIITTNRVLLTLLVIGLGIAALLGVLAGDQVTLKHVHGLTYSQDGKSLFIPSHHGLAIYRDGRWSKAPGPEHDYMGFTGTKAFFYSSGHPAEGSGLVNPFGLIKSADGGKTWQKLGLEGESDFHLLAAGYETNTVYVYNDRRNSRMPRPGLYRTLNDGFSWQPAKAAGLKGEVSSLAVHPADADIVAIGTDTGLFLSRDAGGRFNPFATGRQVLSVFFELEGQHLWYGSFDGAARLSRLDLGTESKEAAIVLPALTQDAVAYIAQNPARRNEFAIATFRRNVFLSETRGKSWRQIAAEGRAQ